MGGIIDAATEGTKRVMEEPQSDLKPKSEQDTAEARPYRLKNVLVTPKMAEKWLAESKYTGQRGLKEWRLQKYTQDMKEGNWRRPEAKIMFGMRPSGDHLINGQHRFTAQVDAGVTLEHTLEWIWFDSDHEMDLVYGSLDSGASRSPRERLHALDIARTIGVSDRMVYDADTALRLIAGDFDRGKSRRIAASLADIRVKETVLLNWRTEIYAYHHALLGANVRVQRWFHRAAVMAVGLITYRYQHEKAASFWYRVAQNDMLPAGSPENKLYEYLATYQADDRDAHHYVRSVAATWNAYWEERSLTKIVTKMTANSVVIMGTPWNHPAAEVDGLSIVLGSK